MDVALLCPLITGIVGWSAPERRLTVVVKGTFALTGPTPGELVDEQHPLNVEWPYGADHGAELELASDYVPRKKRADVFVVGHARANAPSTSIPVYLEVKGVPQRLRKRATAVSNAPLDEIPLTAAHVRSEDGVPTRFAPFPGVRDWRTVIDGTYDFSRFNTAPVDQQIPSVASGCRLVLHGLIEGAESCEMRIAPIEPGVYLVPMRGPDPLGQRVEMRCDTLFIDVDEEVCTLTWRGEIAAPSSDEAYLVVGAAEDTPPTWADLVPQLARAEWLVAAEEEVALRALGIEPTATPTPKRPRRRSKMHTVDLATEMRRSSSSSEALPFRQRVPTGADAAFAELDDDVTVDGEAPSAGGTIPPPPEDAAASDTAPPENATPDTVPPETAPPETAPAETAPAETAPPATQAVAPRIGETIPPPPNGPPSVSPEDVFKSQPPPAGSRPPAAPEDPASIPPAGGTIPPPASNVSSTINLEEGGLSAILGQSAVPFIQPVDGAPAPPPVEPERGRRKRTETRELSNEQIREAFVNVGGPAAPLPFDGAPPPAAPIPPIPAPVDQVPAPAPSSQRGVGPAHVIPPSPVSYPIPPAPLSTREADKPRVAAPPVPQPEALPLSTYAAVKVALLDDDATIDEVLESHDIPERTWRVNERQMAIELARDATDGDGSLAASLQREMEKARRAALAKRPEMNAQEHDLERYLLIRAELDEADDPAEALQELGVTPKDWTKLRRRWSGRCLADPELAAQVRERLAQARIGIRRLWET